MNKLNNKIQLAILKGLNEAFLNLNIDDIEDIEDDSTYILKKDIDNKEENQYFINKLFLKYIDTKDVANLISLIRKGNKLLVYDENICNIISNVLELLGCDIDLNWIDTSNVTNMESLFEDTNFNGNISKWDVSNVTNMQLMFAGTTEFNLSIRDWNVSNVTNMAYMFKFSGFDQDISKWDVSNVKDMAGMFSYSIFNQDISDWDVYNVRDMSLMFYKNTKFNLKLDSWDIWDVEDMTDMFDNDSNMPEWYNKKRWN